MHTIELTHSTSTGHRIPGHEDGYGKCARLHGHTYGYFVQLSAEILDETGFVADFGKIKLILDRWDHRTILWENDPIKLDVTLDFDAGNPDVLYTMIENDAGIVRVPFVPTSENMAQHLAELFVTSFEQVVFATVEVQESPKTKARYYCTDADVRKETNEPRIA